MLFSLRANFTPQKSVRLRFFAVIFHSTQAYDTFVLLYDAGKHLLMFPQGVTCPLGILRLQMTSRRSLRFMKNFPDNFFLAKIKNSLGDFTGVST